MSDSVVFLSYQFAVSVINEVISSLSVGQYICLKASKTISGVV